MRLGIDIGGTHIKYAPVSPHIGRVPMREQADTPTTPGGLARTLEDIICKSQRAYGPFERIGISAMGELDEKRGVIISASNIPGLSGFRLKEYVEKISGVSTAVGNDARCALIAEMQLGAAKFSASCAMLTIGTGVGGAAATREMLGNNSYFAELGHLPLITNGLACTCGRKGCIESYVSCKALENDYYLTSGGKELRAWDILANSGCDEQAAAVSRRYFGHLANALRMIHSDFNAETLIIGGGLAQWQGFLRCLKAAAGLRQDAPMVVERAAFGNDAGLVGATMLEM